MSCATLLQLTEQRSCWCRLFEPQSHSVGCTDLTDVPLWRTHKARSGTDKIKSDLTSSIKAAEAA